ncbi:MAG: DUF2783 domain-containing protein [Oricola sp.]
MPRKIDLATDRLGRNADAFYQALLDAHDGLTLEQSLRMDARLILILANQIGDIDVLNVPLAEAR